MKYMKVLILVLVVQTASSFLFNEEEPLVIGSFNIESLGASKMDKPEVVSTLVRILQRFDIVGIQEIKDSSENNQVFQVLIDKLNKDVENKGMKYDFSISERLGKSSYKEQKAFLYRNSITDNGSRKIKLRNTYVFDDKEEIYDRSPYVGQFNIENTDLPVKDFSMINLHLKPWNVLNESLALRKVVDEINLYNDNIIIMGDMNFDCRYIAGYKKEIVRKELSEFQFYINDDVSTTTSSALCALDRILISGSAFKNSVVEGSNSTYLYYKEFGMTLDQADDVSDHFPVEIRFDNIKPVTEYVRVFDNKEKPLKIGSFNIQSLGPSKISRPNFLATAAEVLSRYDIVLIQEIKDSSKNNIIFQILINELNELVKDESIKYEYVISPRLGRNRYKEQCAFLFRNSFNSSLNDSREISVLEDYVFNDTEKVYDRPPYVARFKLANTDLPVTEFSILNLHLKPSRVFEESFALRKVVDEIKNKNIMIMGDMNFDCRYMAGYKREAFRKAFPDFTFYINDDVSTTTSTALCALDRILISGDSLQNQIVPNSNQTYLYYPKLRLSLDEADDISDHYPVEIQFDN